MIEKQFVENPNPWHPMTDAVDLKHLGKLTEELGECTSAVSRCIIQGIDEVEPSTGEKNREWLTKEIADVLAGIDLVIQRFGLNQAQINDRKYRKMAYLRQWHRMA